MIDERINNNTGIENEEQEIDLVALLFKYLFYWRWFVAIDILYIQTDIAGFL